MVKLGQLEKVTDTALREMTTFQSVGHCPGITSTVVTTPARVGPSGCPPPAHRDVQVRVPDPSTQPYRSF